MGLPQGTLYIPRRGRLVEGLEVAASVGDVVSDTLESRIKVVDGKTRRGLITNGRPCGRIIYNPRGAVSLHSITTLRGVKEGRVFVVGEEDLLTASLAWNMDEGTIAYGQPGVGVVVVVADKVRLMKFIKILKPSIISYNT
jgi:uncharacterized protein (UPF0218 family)